MKILLIGSGAVGSVMAKLLVRDRSVSKVVCATDDVQRGRAFIEITHKKLRLIKLDASNVKEVVRAANDMDLIINAALPRYNKKIMKAALKAKVNYQDLCTYFADYRTPEQLAFHEKFQQAKLVGLFQTGVAPGVTNLLAREIGDTLDAVSDIKIRLIEEQKSSAFVFSWSPEVTLDELSAPPLVYREGTFNYSEPFGDVEQYPYPAPFGPKYAVNIWGDEVTTIPRYVKTNNVDYKSSGAEIDLSRTLYNLGLFNTQPVSVKGKRIVPRDFSLKLAPKTPTPQEIREMMTSGTLEDAYFLSVVEGIGREARHNIRIRYTITYPSLQQIPRPFRGATHISYATGVAAVVFAKVIGKSDTYGMYPPEVLDAHLR